jgi:hypothetical protein
MGIVKKLLKIIGIFFGVLILAALILPVVFKGKIVDTVKELANDNVNAKVDFGDFSLSLISSFPDFSFEISDISVINNSPFEGDTLAYIGDVSVELDLMSVIGGEYVVSNFEIDNVVANAKIMEDGLANWDIAIPDSLAVIEEVVTEEETASSDDKLITGLESFSIKNVNISYVDLQSEMVAIIKNFNQSGSLLLNGDSTDINVKTGIEALTFVLGGERLANKIKFESDVKIAADLEKMIFDFKENQFRVNELKLGMDGRLAMPDDMIFDLTLSAKDNKFRDLLSLIPAVYKTDIEGIDVKGDFSLTAALSGKMNDESLPGFDVDFSINNGFIKYPDLPESVKDINMELAIDNPDGIIDHTIVDLSLFNFKIAQNPIDIKFYVTNVESDPNMRGYVRSKFKLENLAKAIPMEEGEEYKGGVNANLDFAGKMSAIEEERYEDFKASGSIIFDNLLYKSPDLPTTLVKTGYLKFSPQQLEVSNFDMKIGKSDLVANGSIDNILPYVFKDETIKGSFNLKSEFFDLDELMAEDSTAVKDSTEKDVAVEEAINNAQDVSSSTEEEGVIAVPNNVDFALLTSFKKVNYDGMLIDNFIGDLYVKDETVKFNVTGMEILSGKAKMNGSYNTKDIKKPIADFKMSIDKMGIGEAYKTFNTVKKMIPIAKNTEGEFSTDITFKTELTDSMTPVYESISGLGSLETTNLGIAETDAWKGLIGALKIKDSKYDKIKAEDVKIDYEFKDGKLYTKPFKLNLGKVKGKVSGWTSFDNKIEYTYELQIPREDIGGTANTAIEGGLALLGNSGMDISIGEYINIDVIVSGDMDKPSYKVRPGGTSAGEKSTKEKTVEAVKEKVKEEIGKVKEKAKEEINKAKKEAEKKAKEEADKLKKEAESKAKAEVERLKKEAEAKAKKELEKKGKNALKGLFK